MPVRKTTVYLDEADYRALKRIAHERGRKPAALLREAVATYTRGNSVERKRPRSLGAGHSRRGDLAEHAEKLLKGFGRS